MPLSLEMVAHKTAKDTVLLQVIQEIETFWKSPTHAPELQAYYTMHHELTVKVGRLDFMLRVNWSCKATRCLFLQPLDSNYL